MNNNNNSDNNKHSNNTGGSRRPADPVGLAPGEALGAPDARREPICVYIYIYIHIYIYIYIYLVGRENDPDVFTVFSNYILDVRKLLKTAIVVDSFSQMRNTCFIRFLK